MNESVEPSPGKRDELAAEWADKEYPESVFAPENEALADAAYEGFCAGYDAGLRALGQGES
jgi:hypothetical protein